MVRQLDTLFSSFDEWVGTGLGRMAIHNVFELSEEHLDREVAKEVFIIADKWFDKSRNLALVGLRAGAKAAGRCGLDRAKEQYEALANREQALIEAMREMNTRGIPVLWNFQVDRNEDK
jgi:hypothetical protein